MKKSRAGTERIAACSITNFARFRFNFSIFFCPLRTRLRLRQRVMLQVWRRITYQQRRAVYVYLRSCSCHLFTGQVLIF
jgi:hypothetical protein